MKLQFSSGDWKLNLSGSDPEDAIGSAFACSYVGRVGFIGGRFKKSKNRLRVADKNGRWVHEKKSELYSEITVDIKGIINYNRFLYILEKTRMTQEDLKYLLISLDFTQALFL